MIEKYFWQYWSQLGLSRDEFVSVALQQQNWGPAFAMTVLALKASDRHNGVSSLATWRAACGSGCTKASPRTTCRSRRSPTACIPPPWLAPAMRRLFETYMASDWEDRIDDVAMWQKIQQISTM
ncbi:MAG: hypothetical protein U0Z44_09245 [Kouleothrix sp.]